MAVLSRRGDDGGFYTRINIGGIVTRQVHPDAVLFLTKRGVYVGDEIPTELMRKIRTTKNWLYTKEEFPFVVFDEHRDPSFGVRSAPRSSLRGTTRVVASGPPLTRSGQTLRPSATNLKESRRQTMVAAQLKAKAQEQPRTSSWSEPLPQDPVVASSRVATPYADDNAGYSTDSPVKNVWKSTDTTNVVLKAFDMFMDWLSTRGITHTEESFQLNSKSDDTLLSRLRHWYSSGADLSVWWLLLILLAFLGIAYGFSAVVEAVF